MFEFLGAMCGFWIIYAILASFLWHKKALIITSIIGIGGGLCSALVTNNALTFLSSCFCMFLLVIFKKLRINNDVFENEDLQNETEKAKTFSISGATQEEKSEIENEKITIHDIETTMYNQFAIIKTNEERIKNCGSLYNASHYKWKVSLEKVKNCRYVIAVVNKIVRNVYEVSSWQPAQNRYGENGAGRVEFVGQEAPKEIRDLFVGNKIPYEYRKKGLSNPFIFLKPNVKWYSPERNMSYLNELQTLCKEIDNNESNSNLKKELLLMIEDFYKNDVFVYIPIIKKDNQTSIFAINDDKGYFLAFYTSSKFLDKNHSGSVMLASIKFVINTYLNNKNELVGVKINPYSEISINILKNSLDSLNLK